MTGTAGKQAWYYRPWMVILLLFFLGPFAFPILFKSPAFHPAVKFFLAVVTVVFTVWALWVSVDTVKAVLARLKEEGLVIY